MSIDLIPRLNGQILLIYIKISIGHGHIVCTWVLSLWVDFQVMFIGYWHFIQTIFAIFGILILVIALLPGVRSYYNLKE